ncbi:MAG: hypothetical protein WCB18_04645 [Thermoplasmata archaeon]
MNPNPADLPRGRRAVPPWQPSMGSAGDSSERPAPRADDVWFLPSTWDRRAVAILVWGASRPIVNRVVFSMVRSLDAMPLWLEVSERGEKPEPLREGWVPPERLFVSERPEDLEPARAAGNLALWGVVRSDEPATLLARLTDFVRLPPLVQEVLGGATPTSRLRALAVGNADRVAPLFRERPEELQWLVNYLRESSLCLIVGGTIAPGAGRGSFDSEFHVEGQSMEAWSEATVVCDRSRIGGYYPIGRPRALSKIPGLADLFPPPG